MVMNLRTGLVPEDELITGSIPWTKEEVRAVTLARLDLRPEDKVLEIGGGTGAMTVEIAHRVPRGSLCTIEKNKEAVKLIKSNQEKFNLTNLKVITGVGPGDLPSEQYARIFIGGSAGHLEEILHYAEQHLSPQGIIVCNSVTLNTVNEVYTYFKTKDYQLKTSLVQVSKIVERGDYLMYQGQNPIHVITIKPGSRLSGSERSERGDTHGR